MNEENNTNINGQNTNSNTTPNPVPTPESNTQPMNQANQSSIANPATVVDPNAGLNTVQQPNINLEAVQNPNPTVTNVETPISTNPITTDSPIEPQPNISIENPTVQSQPIEDSKTVQFVNPLNPTEVVKTKNLEVPKTVIVKPEPNQPILATTPIVPNQEIPANSPTPVKPTKKKNNILVIIVAVIMILVISVVIYFTFFNKKTPAKPTPPVTPPVEEQPIVPKTSLTDVENKLKENTDFQKLEITTSVQNNQLLFKIVKDTEETSYIYELKENLLSTTFKNDDLSAMMIFSYVADAIGQCNGNEAGDVIAYFNSIGILQAKVEGLTITTKEDTYEISLNIDTKFDTSSLKTMYFQIEDFKPVEDMLINTGSYQSAKGYLLFYKAGDTEKTTIILAEKKQLSELTYKSILSIIELLYNDELENFKTNYPELKDATFDRYTITINPTLTGLIETLYGEYQEDYKFIEIVIDKTV